MRRLLLALLLLLGIAYSVVWWWDRPLSYQLTIVNSSELVMDSVAFVGSDIAGRVEIVKLHPGESAYLETKVQQQGELRIEIIQSGNKIDALLKKKTESLDETHQQLTIYPGHRYIFSSDS
ncbi:MAG: hypothetical protein V7459_03560 [Oceanicoccus sp.]